MTFVDRRRPGAPAPLVVPGLALALVLALAPPARAQDSDLIPGLGRTDAQILARPAEGQLIVRARATIFRRALESAIAPLCGAPARATALFRDSERKPADITYLVRCRP